MAGAGGGCPHPASGRLPASCQTLPDLCCFPWGSGWFGALWSVHQRVSKLGGGYLSKYYPVSGCPGVPYTHCHPAAALPVLWGIPPLTDGRIRPSAAALSLLWFTDTLGCCVTGVQGTSAVRYPAPVFAPWYHPSWGTRRGDKEPRAPWAGMCWVSRSALRWGPGR